MIAITAPRPAGWRLTTGILVFAALGNLVYWVIWFFVDRSALASLDTDTYYAFQNAFVLADGWLTACCVLGAHALLRRRSSALFFVLLASSASIFLGSMDTLFDVQNGVYERAAAGPLVTEVLINAFAFGGGAWGIWFCWYARRELMELSP